MLSIGSHSLQGVMINLKPGAGNVARRSKFSVAPTSRVVTVLYLSGSISSLHHQVRGVLLKCACSGGPFAIGSLNITKTVAILLGSTVRPGLMRAARNATTFIRKNPFTGVTRKYGSVLTAGVTVAFNSCMVARTNFNTSLKTRGFCGVGYHGDKLRPHLAIVITATRKLGVRKKIDLSHVGRPGLRKLERNLHGLSGRIHGLRSFNRAIVITFGGFTDSASRRVRLLHRRYRRLKMNCTVGGTFSRNNRNTISLTGLIIRAVRGGPSRPLRFACGSRSDMQRGVRGITAGLCNTDIIACDALAHGGVGLVRRVKVNRCPMYVTGARCSFSTSPGMCKTMSGFRLRVGSVIVGGKTRVVMTVTNRVVHVPNLPGRPRTLRVSVISNGVRKLDWAFPCAKENDFGGRAKG